MVKINNLIYKEVNSEIVEIIKCDYKKNFYD